MGIRFLSVSRYPIEIFLSKQKITFIGFTVLDHVFEEFLEKCDFITEAMVL